MDGRVGELHEVVHGDTQPAEKDIQTRATSTIVVGERTTRQQLDLYKNRKAENQGAHLRQALPTAAPADQFDRGSA